MQDGATTGSGDSKGLARLWASFFAGPVAWIVNQGIGYAVMKPVCSAADVSALWLIGSFAFILAGAGAWTAARCLLALRDDAIDEGGRVIDRNYFVAVVAVGVDALIAILIVTSVIPQFLLSPCE
jgi:hypothetical protein